MVLCMYIYILYIYSSHGRKSRWRKGTEKSPVHKCKRNLFQHSTIPHLHYPESEKKNRALKIFEGLFSFNCQKYVYVLRSYLELKLQISTKAVYVIYITGLKCMYLPLHRFQRNLSMKGLGKIRQMWTKNNIS